MSAYAMSCVRREATLKNGEPAKVLSLLITQLLPRGFKHRPHAGVAIRDVGIDLLQNIEAVL